jgi:hypothetical protein
MSTPAAERTHWQCWKCHGVTLCAGQPNFCPYCRGTSFSRELKTFDDEMKAFRQATAMQRNGLGPTIPNAIGPGENPQMPPSQDEVEIKAVLHGHFYTGEPGEHEAIEAATKLLLARSPSRPLTKAVEKAIADNVANLSMGFLFNELVRRLNYDGPDTASLTLGEIARAVHGAELPK